MKNKLWGFAVLILVLGVAYWYSIQKPAVELTGLLGGEKIGLFENQEFQKYLKKEYNLTLDYRKDGSFSMVKADTEGRDYLFPSSQLALELFKKEGKKSSRDDIIFNTPIVLYSYKPVVDVLMNKGVVTERSGVYYVNMVELANIIKTDQTWNDIGLQGNLREVAVDTTDPSASNSGNMFLGLLANAMNGNRVVGMEQAKAMLPELKKIYDSIGYMNTSSADMFSQFLTLGYGSYPLVAGYESQMLEFSVSDPDTYQRVKDKIFILYPEPTVWSSHVFISLRPEADIAITALKDKKVQELAWKYHGYRTIVAGSGDTKQFQVPGVAEEVTQIMSMPSYDVMDYLVNGLSN